MTREEYIGFANALKNNYTIDFDKLPEFCDMAVSVLSAIEKIRAEIQENLDTYKEYGWEEEVKAYTEVLEIIDKHIGGGK